MRRFITPVVLGLLFGLLGAALAAWAVPAPQAAPREVQAEPPQAEEAGGSI